MLSICFLYHKGRISRLSSVLEGCAPSEFFYGALELQKKGVKVDLYEIDLSKAPGIFGGVANIAAAYNYLPEKLDGAAMVQTKKILARIKNYDCIVATTSGIAYGLAAWKSIGFYCPPIIAIHCGLFNNPYTWPKLKLSTFFLRKMNTILFGEGELKSIQNIAPDASISVNQFGVDLNFWHPIKRKGNSSPYLLAVGNDGRRDYKTFIEAVKDIKIHCRIITKHVLPSPLPNNIEHICGDWHEGGISDKALRLLYQEASCVVTPLLASEQPSGQSVTLQAMACGKPVILTKTRGLWSKKSVIDRENVFLVAPGDYEMMNRAIDKILNDRELAYRLGQNARRAVEIFGSIESFADRILTTCEAALSDN